MHQPYGRGGGAGQHAGPVGVGGRVERGVGLRRPQWWNSSAAMCSASPQVTPLSSPASRLSVPSGST
ncbi:hypothetical protein ABT059_30405, partial [Micromonospora tulbaghiae]|uniref:hypothetical protein n=1 Tax=Micromonospora tulbaghiae TaxID=479978 RepID=UPI00332422B6